MYIHPAQLLTSPFFTGMAVTIHGTENLLGRTTWRLEGQQAATGGATSSLGDAWRMWVDQRTGVILRLEYYAGQQLIGWAGFTDFTADDTAASASTDLTTWSLPADAHYVEDPAAYNRLALSSSG